jgi:DNA-binding beta-propeller fold protein YncE
VDGFVHVFDSDNHRVQAFRADGSFVTAWGSQGSGDGQFASSAALDVDPTSRLYVMDMDNARVQVFDALSTPARRSTWGAVKRSWR